MRHPRSGTTASSIVAAFALAAAGAALAAEPPKKPPEAAAKPAVETNAKEQLVCTTEAVTGSLRPKRVCVSQKQINAQREAVEDLNRERRELGGASAGETGSMVPSGTLLGR
jgi:hypothetical protein